MFYLIVVLGILFGGGDVSGVEQISKNISIETNATASTTFLETRKDNLSEKITNTLEFNSSTSQISDKNAVTPRVESQSETLPPVTPQRKTNKTAALSHVENINYTDHQSKSTKPPTEQFHDQTRSVKSSHQESDSVNRTDLLETSFVSNFVKDFNNLARTLSSDYTPSNEFLESFRLNTPIISSVDMQNNRHPHFMDEDGEVYQWSVEEERNIPLDPTSVVETDAEEVYYSAYPEFEDVTRRFYDDDDVAINQRELRSVNEENLDLIAKYHSNSTSIISTVLNSVSSTISSTTNLKSILNSNISPTPVLSARVSEIEISDVFAAENSQSSTHKIDDIINGLVHLLGDNVKVANSTDAHHTFNSDYTSKSTRINNRGPPTFVTTNEDTTSSTNSKSSTATLDDSIKFTHSTSTLTSFATTDASILSSSRLTQSVKQTSSYSTSSVSSEHVVNHPFQSSVRISSSRIPQITSSKEFIPTGPITAWKPVFQYGLDRFNTATKLPGQINLPDTGIRQMSTSSDISGVYPIPNLQPPVIPIATNTNPNINSISLNPTTTTKTAALINDHDQLTLITADEAINNDFVDIVLTATGVMNGMIPSKPTVFSTTTSDRSTTKDDQSVFIDGRRQYFTIQPQESDSWKGDVNNGHATINRTINKNSAITSPPSTVKKPTTTPSAYKPKQTTPAIRIDTCIVGDDSSCDTNNHEVCRTEGGVSSCLCPPALSRDKNSNECIAVLSLLMYLRIDRFNNKRILFENSFLSESAQSERLKNEVVQAINSLFKSSSLAPIYFGSNLNTFYAIGGKLAANLTILLHENVYTSTPLIKQVISRELLATIEQQNQTIGNSRLSVDTLLNPIPSIIDFNECADPELNDCSVNAECENTFGTFKCNCQPGFTDKFPDDSLKRGRICTACSAEYCNNHGTCVLNGGVAECSCKGSYIGNKCEIDSEVLGVALGASLVALLIIILTFICLCMWSRRWKKEQHKPQLHSACPSFTYMDKTTKSQCDLHTLVSDNTLQWFPMRDSRSNFYLMEPPDHSQMTLARSKSAMPSGMSTRPSHLSHSQTKLLGSDDCLNEEHARFYVPRPKARSRTEQQNIYSDLETMREDELNSTGFHQGQAVSNAYYMHNLRSYHK